MSKSIKTRSVFGSAKQAMSSSADIIVEVAVATSELVGLAKDQIIVARATNRVSDVGEFVLSRLDVLADLRSKLAVEDIDPETKADLELAITQVKAVQLVY